MNITEKLDYLMSERNMNKSLLSKETGIPYTTIDGFYKKGTDNIKLSTLRKLADCFNITLDEIADDGIDIKNKTTNEYCVSEDISSYGEPLSNNLKSLLNVAKDVPEDDLKIVVEMVKRMKK